MVTLLDKIDSKEKEIEQLSETFEQSRSISSVSSETRESSRKLLDARRELNHMYKELFRALAIRLARELEEKGE